MVWRPAQILAILLIAAAAPAAIVRVPDDYAIIQAAVDAASGGDTVLVAPGNYTGPGNYNITWSHGVAVIGEKGSEATIIDCQGLGRGFRLYGGYEEQNALSGFTIRNGYGNNGGGASISGDHPKVEDLKIQDCTATNAGGGLWIGDFLSISHCEIIDCMAYKGGGIFANMEAWPPDSISDLVIRGNAASSHGGGIYLESYCYAILERVTLVGNQPDALYLAPGDRIWINDCIIAFNPGEGPAIDTSQWGDVDFDQVCSDVFGNPGGNYGAFIEDPTGTDGNIAEDPIFCDLPGGDLTLFDLSPCLPENNACGVQMGARGLGCEANTSISGRILTDRGVPMPGIEVHGPTLAITNHNGDYELLVPEGWNGEIAPSGWFHFNSFEPPSRSYENVSGHIADQDFTGTGRHVCEIPADYEDIEAALDAAFAGDTLRVAPGTYYPQGRYGLDFQGKGVCLTSSNGPELTTLDFAAVQVPAGQEGDYCGIYFHSGEDSSTVLDGFTLTGIDSPEQVNFGYCLRCDGGASPSLRRLTFSGNHSYVGGGLYSIDSSPRVEDCRFIGNEAFWEGGAIACSGGSLAVRRTIFEGNRGNTGGAIGLFAGAGALIEDSKFIGNRGLGVMGGDEVVYAGLGGAIALYESTCDLSACLLVGNRALAQWENASAGGAIDSRYSTLSIESCTLADNSDNGSARGGHLYFTASQIDVFSSIFAFAASGGGIYQEGAGSELNFACNDVYGNVDGDYLGTIEDQTGIDGNISADPRFCDLDGGDFHLEASSPCLPANNDCEVQMGTCGEGCDLTDSSVPEVPERIFLAQNHPNPFNPKTEIPFGLPAKIAVSLTVFDIQGRCVATLLDSQLMAAGAHSVQWDGHDSRGRAVPSGVYFYRLQAENLTTSEKMVLLR